jgi:hypothetical protein
METIECARCGRQLKSPKAKELGYGIICWRKILAEQAIAEQKAQAAIVIETSIMDGYAGARDVKGNVKVVAIRNGKQYPLRHLVRHSPDGFNWGYGGSGPADLARSIIADALGIDDPNPTVYQEFKRSFVASWGDRWEISQDEIREWVRSVKEVEP